MPIKATGSAGGEIPAGTQVRWRVARAGFDEAGTYGPEIKLELDVITEEYAGTSTLYSAKIAQPRIDKANRLRGDGVDDETIEAILRKQGFAFDDLDEEDEMSVARGGVLYALLVANEGDTRGAERVLREVGSFDELAERLVGTCFVGTSKLDKKNRVRLDATEEIFRDVEASDDDEPWNEMNW